MHDCRLSLLCLVPDLTGEFAIDFFFLWSGLLVDVYMVAMTRADVLL